MRPMLVLLSALAFAVPMELTHQGRVFDATGAPLTGSHSLTVRIYAGATGGTAVWSDTLSVSFDDGYFSLVLGQGTALDSTVFDGSTRYVSLQVDSGAETQDRHTLVSVPYALQARSVVGGVVDASEIRIDGNVVIDSSGALVGTGDGDTLAELSCSADQIPLYNGADWTCTAAASATVAWADVTTKPTGFADNVDDDALGTLNCLEGQSPVFNNLGDWVCGPPTLTELEVEGFITNGALDLAAGTTVGGQALVSGTVDYADIANTPTEQDIEDLITNGALDLASGTTLGGQTVFTGSIDWTDVQNRPAGLDDGDNDTIVTTLSWDDLTDVPTEFQDGDDDVLGDLSCADGQYVSWQTDHWDCADVSDALGAGGTLTLGGGLQLGDDTASCDSGARGTLRFNSDRLQVCVDSGWRTLAGGDDGSDAASPGETCNTIHTAYPGLGDGTYWIDPDGPGGDGAMQVFCDMSTDGGGWTLAGYSYNATTGTSSNNQAFRSLQCGGGTYSPESRGAASAAIGSVALARKSTEVAFSMSSSGQVIATGNMQAYATAHKFNIPSPSTITFVSQSYDAPTYSAAGPCVAVTVEGIHNSTFSGTRYTLQNTLGTSWTDTYPTGYGAADTTNCVNHDGGPFITSIHTGDRRNGNFAECDVVNGRLDYTHRGNYTPENLNRTGSHAIWFR